MRRSYLSVMVVLAAAVAAWGQDEPKESIGQQLAALTGAHTRVVWTASATKGRLDREGRQILLMGVDSEDGRGPRRVVRETANYFKPLLTADGKTVIFTNRVDRYVMAVGFDGTNYREICAGWALDVWRDPQTGHDWVFVQQGEDEEMARNPLYRVRLDDPQVRELVWNRTPVTDDNFQLGRSGKRAVGVLPWPHCGVMQLPNKGWTKYGNGCWTSIAPDDSGLWWRFENAHRNLVLSQVGEATHWLVPVDDGPDIGDNRMQCPRWSNHVRIFALVGPHDSDKQRPDILVGRFAPDYRSVEAWVRIRRPESRDYYPDVWVAGGEKTTVPEAVRSAGRVVKADDQWPTTEQGLRWYWQNDRSANQLSVDGQAMVTCRVEPVGKVHYGPQHQMLLGKGGFRAVDAGRRWADAVKQSGEFTLEMVLTPIGEYRHPEPVLRFVAQEDQTPNLFVGIGWGSHIMFEVAGLTLDPPRRDPAVWSFELATRQPQHVVITVTAEGYDIYLNGEHLRRSEDARHKPTFDFSKWSTQQPLVFGGPDGNGEWAGMIEGVALYSRALDAEAIGKSAAVWMKRFTNRQPADQVEVRAKLVARSEMPDPSELAEYRRALVVYEYDVVNIHRGQLDAEKVRVAHYGVLDAKTQAHIADRKVGRNYTLTLEPMEAHPQLDSERVFDDLDDPTAKRWFDVGR